MSGFLLPSVSPIDQPEGVPDERAVWEAIDPWLAQYGLVDYAQQTHIHAVISDATKKMGRLPTGEELAYHFHFWSQRLRERPHVKLRWDEIHQVLYPQAGRTVPVFPGRALNRSPRSRKVLSLINNGLGIDLQRLPVNVPTALIFEYYVKNFKEVCAELERVRMDVERVLADRTLFIATNHSTWINLPIIARALTSSALDIPPEQIYIILGPALVTYEQGFRAPLTFANLLKTIPDTQNGVIPDQEEPTQAIRKRFFGVLKSITRQPGNVVIYAPSGTRDVCDTNNQSIGIKKPAAPGLRLPATFGGAVLPIGTNDLEIVADNHLRRGREHLRVGDLIEQPSRNGGEIMPAVASLIVDAAGRPIGKLLDTPA